MNEHKKSKLHVCLETSQQDIDNHMLRLMEAAGAAKANKPPVIVCAHTPSWRSHILSQFEDHIVVDEVPQYDHSMRPHQKHWANQYLRGPVLRGGLLPQGVLHTDEVSLDFEQYLRHGDAMVLSPMFGHIERFTLVEDHYIAPPKKQKDWAFLPGQRHGKNMMEMALFHYRVKNHKLFFPEFDWVNRREAQRRMKHIQHLNVGTVGHIDWGNNRVTHPRPHFPGYLAESIRAFINSL